MTEVLSCAVNNVGRNTSTANRNSDYPLVRKQRMSTLLYTPMLMQKQDKSWGPHGLVSRRISHQKFVSLDIKCTRFLQHGPLFVSLIIHYCYDVVNTCLMDEYAFLYFIKHNLLK